MNKSVLAEESKSQFFENIKKEQIEQLELIKGIIAGNWDSATKIIDTVKKIKEIQTSMSEQSVENYLQFAACAVDISYKHHQKIFNYLKDELEKSNFVHFKKSSEPDFRYLFNVACRFNDKDLANLFFNKSYGDMLDLVQSGLNTSAEFSSNDTYDMLYDIYSNWVNNKPGNNNLINKKLILNYAIIGENVDLTRKLLSDESININLIEDDSNWPLRLIESAVGTGNIEVFNLVSSFIKIGNNPGEISASSLLSSAISKKVNSKADILEKLLLMLSKSENELLTHQQNLDVNSAFRLSIKYGDMQSFDKLLNLIDINSTETSQNILYAISECQNKMVEKFLATGIKDADKQVLQYIIENNFKPGIKEGRSRRSNRFPRHKSYREMFFQVNQKDFLINEKTKSELLMLIFNEAVNTASGDTLNDSLILASKLGNFTAVNKILSKGEFKVIGCEALIAAASNTPMLAANFQIYEEYSQYKEYESILNKLLPLSGNISEVLEKYESFFSPSARTIIKAYVNGEKPYSHEEEKTTWFSKNINKFKERLYKLGEPHPHPQKKP